MQVLDLSHQTQEANAETKLHLPYVFRIFRSDSPLALSHFLL